MNYEEWNNKIASYFFRTEYDGKRIFLCVEEDLIGELAGREALDDFVNAIKEGPSGPLKYARGICSAGRALKDRWRNGGAEGMPPYLATLALFVLAAGFEAEFEGYHKRLNELVGEPVSNKPLGGFYDAFELWEDLENWANNNHNGQCGIFRIEFAGNWKYVAVPQSQTLLTEKERAILPEIFSDAGLDPTISVSNEELARNVVQHGRGKLLKRTLRRLENKGEGGMEFRQILLETLQEELESADLLEHDTDETSHKAARAIRLMVNLRYVPLVNAVEVGLQFNAGTSFMDSSFSIEGQNSKCKLDCETSGEDWSQFLTSEGKTFDASKLDWKRGENFVSTIQGAKFIFPAAKVRVFQDGQFNNAPNLIEKAKLPAKSAFWITVADDAPEIIVWGKANCPGWQPVKIDSGLPCGWACFKADFAVSTHSIEQKYPILSLPSFARLNLVGGIKLGKSNRYLDVAAPKIQIETPAGTYSLEINGQVQPISSTQIEFPVGLCQQHNTIELKNADNPSKSRKCSFYITDAASLPWKDGLAFGVSNGIGRPVNFNSAEEHISGAIVTGVDLPPYPC